MKTFEELKEELLNRAKNANACQNGYRMGFDAQNKADLLKAITANWFWVLRNAKIVDARYLEEILPRKNFRKLVSIHKNTMR